MPNSPPNDNPAAVRDYLASVLPNAQLNDTAVSADYQPILLMQTAHVVAGFAFANGDLRRSYEVLYGGFKQHYSAQQGRWDALDLAFVFCISADAPQIDQFCSSVETDVYFCRKFVVPINGSVGPSLARLPFLPLSPLAGQSLRPPSAQTLLQQCNVPAVLAKYLVVQHERSAQGIVEDCAAGEFGDPEPLTVAATAPAIQAERAAESVRLEALEIQNFRAYRRPQRFALGADVTVLYGPNGFGKTSFFDAIDFAVTGGIGRIEARRQSDFAKTARHLDAGDEESAVVLTFLSKGVVRKIERSVQHRKQGMLDSRPTERKAILTALTGSHLPPTDRVENFVSLFRASHLFSQEQQELTKDFHDDCRLSANIVSRMLAFEDYANAVNKTADVREVLQSIIAGCVDEIRILTQQITADNRELERLGQTAKLHVNAEAIGAELEALRAKLAAGGITVTSAKPDTSVVRGWRAAVEARLAENRTHRDRLTALAREVAGLPRIRTELASVEQQLAAKEAALGAAERKRDELEEIIRQGEKQIAEENAKRTEAQSRLDLLAWIRSAQPEYQGLQAQQRQLDGEIRQLSAGLAQLRASEDKAADELRTKESAAGQIAQKLATLRTELAAVQALRQTLPAWEANRSRFLALAQIERTQLTELEAARNQLKDLGPLHAAAIAEEKRLVRQIAEVDKNQSELRTLISQLQGHVHSGVCPLCGEDHGSTERLVQRIQSHVAVDAATGARADLAGTREKTKQLAERIAGGTQRETAIQTKLAELKSERDRLQNEIAQFADKAAKLVIVLEAAGPTPAEQAQTLVGRLEQDAADLDRQRIETGAAVEAARLTAARAKNSATARQTEIEQKRGLLARAQQEIVRLRGDHRLTQLSLDIEPGGLTELEETDRKKVEATRVAAAKVDGETAAKKRNLGVVRQEITSLKAQLSTLRTQVNSLRNTLAQIVAKLGEAKLPLDSTEESLRVLIAEQTRLEEQWLALQITASGMEMALDAATTAAALTTLRQTVRNREKTISETSARRDRHQPWLKYFEEVSRLLSARQNEAIANFTREYGPRTSVIQRRLRSVYGFDDIEIRAATDSISVRIKRNGEELRPVDYFSQSQQQTLLLGLFLTACSSQTWSAFSPVFLDDPVTHFDDLNTYAFLDLLVGFLESETDKRQFVLSTCDEKLLQLARQKFRHFGDRARFYQFTAIGADGPCVTHIA